MHIGILAAIVICTAKIGILLSGQTDIVAISVLEAGMPMAITPFILAELYPMEREVIALSIVISCLFSVITLPIIMVLVGVV